jgi:hypothetical protein
MTRSTLKHAVDTAHLAAKNRATLNNE